MRDSSGLKKRRKNFTRSRLRHPMRTCFVSTAMSPHVEPRERAGGSPG
jgi:hypothetical protein